MGSTIARLSRLFGAVGFLGSCEDALSPDAATFAKSGSSKLAPPSGTDAIPMLSDRVDVFWTDNSTNEGGFRVERSTNGGGTWVSAGTTGPGQMWSFDDGRESEQQVCYRAFLQRQRRLRPVGDRLYRAPSRADRPERHGSGRSDDQAAVG